MIPPTNNWRKRRTNNTWSLLQTTGRKDEQTRHDPSYKQQAEKTNKQDMITTGGKDEPNIACMRKLYRTSQHKNTIGQHKN
jgi:hypothetical protein